MRVDGAPTPRLTASGLTACCGRAVVTSFCGPARSSRSHSSRAYATYSGVCIAADVAWGWLIDVRTPDLREHLGAGICLLGAAIIVALSMAMGPCSRQRRRTASDGAIQQPRRGR